MSSLVLAEQQSLLRMKRNQPFRPGVQRMTDDGRYFEINKVFHGILILRSVSPDEFRPPFRTLDSSRATYYWAYGLCRLLMNHSARCNRRARNATGK